MLLLVGGGADAVHVPDVDVIVGPNWDWGAEFEELMSRDVGTLELIVGTVAVERAAICALRVSAYSLSVLSYNYGGAEKLKTNWCGMADITD